VTLGKSSGREGGGDERLFKTREEGGGRAVDGWGVGARQLTVWWGIGVGVIELPKGRGRAGRGGNGTEIAWFGMGKREKTLLKG